MAVSSLLAGLDSPVSNTSDLQRLLSSTAPQPSRSEAVPSQGEDGLDTDWSIRTTLVRDANLNAVVDSGEDVLFEHAAHIRYDFARHLILNAVTGARLGTLDPETHMGQFTLCISELRSCTAYRSTEVLPNGHPGNWIVSNMPVTLSLPDSWQ